MELGRPADRPDRPYRVIHVLGDRLLAGVNLGCGVDRDAVVGPGNFAAKKCLVVEGVVPRRHAGDHVVVELLGVSSAFTVSGELRITLSFLSTRLPPCAHRHQYTQALPSPVAWPSAMPPGVLLRLVALAYSRNSSVVAGNFEKPAFCKAETR